MKNITIILVFILLNSCSSSKTSTQTEIQDKPKITNLSPVIIESTSKTVEKPQIKALHLVILTDSSDIKKGEELYIANTCSACHLDDGGGLIGPNLTDAYTISGCSFEEIFNVIAKGGRPSKGMIGWEQMLSKKEIQQLTSYILTLQGKTPEEPKRPEGELCTE